MDTFKYTRPGDSCFFCVSLSPLSVLAFVAISPALILLGFHIFHPSSGLSDFRFMMQSCAVERAGTGIRGLKF